MTPRIYYVTPEGYTGARTDMMAALAARLPLASTRIQALTFTRRAVSVALQARDWTPERFQVEADMLRAVADGVVANVRWPL